MEVKRVNNLPSVSERMRALGFVGTLLIILIHMSRVPRGWMSCKDMMGFTWMEVFVNFGVIFCLGRLAVPMFFIISGYWLMKNYTPSVTWWINVVRTRVNTLILPMFIWACIALCYEFIFGSIRIPDSYNWFLPAEVMQFWFFRTLFIYIVISPVLCVVVRHKRMGLCLVSLLWLFAFCGIPGQSQYFSWINDAAFTFGIWLGLHNKEVKFSLYSKNMQLINCWGGAFIIVCIAAVLSAIFHQRIIYNRIMYILVVVGIVLLWAVSPLFVRLFHRLDAIYSLNIFIFATHFVILSRIGSLLTNCGMKHQTVVFMVLQYITTVIVCISIGLIIKKFCPRLLKWLSGGRG